MNQKPKSVQSVQNAYIRFINKTKRDVDVFWLDYEGVPVKYQTLEPDAYYDVTTFIGHPWIFKDSKTKDKLIVNNEFIFYPPCWTEIFRRSFPTREEVPPHRIVVMITLPLYKLRERCLQVVRDNINLSVQAELIHQLELPKSVLDDLIVMLLKKDGLYM